MNNSKWKIKKKYIQNSRFVNKTLFSFYFSHIVDWPLKAAWRCRRSPFGECPQFRCVRLSTMLPEKQKKRREKSTRKRMPLEMCINAIVSYALCFVDVGLYRIYLITTHLPNVPRTQRKKWRRKSENCARARALPNLLLYDITACKRQSGSARAPHLPFCNKLNISAKACWGSKSLRIVINAIFLVSLTHTHQPFLRDIKHSFDGVFGCCAV